MQYLPIGLEPTDERLRRSNAVTGGLYADAEPMREALSVCVGSCITDCALPCCALCCCPCRFFQGGLTYRIKDPYWGPLKFRLCHRLQSWLIRHPVTESRLFCCLRPCITVHDVAAYGGTMINGFRKEIGDVWCDNLKVEVANPETARLIMTSPQDGGPSLGQNTS